nr:MAG TPA: hypothetical protein [Caudoviricetes sp.]
MRLRASRDCRRIPFARICVKSFSPPQRWLLTMATVIGLLGGRRIL